MKKQIIITLFLIILFLVWVFLDAYAISDFLWDQVMSNADGTQCVDLAGYEIHCGNTPGLYTILKDCGMKDHFLLPECPCDSVHHLFEIFSGENSGKRVEEVSHRSPVLPGAAKEAFLDLMSFPFQRYERDLV